VRSQKKFFIGPQRYNFMVHPIYTYSCCPLRDLYASQSSRRVHSAGLVDSVTPNVKDGFCSSNHTTDKWTHANTCKKVGNKTFIKLTNCNVTHTQYVESKKDMTTSRKRQMSPKAQDPISPWAQEAMSPRSHWAEEPESSLSPESLSAHEPESPTDRDSIRPRFHEPREPECPWARDSMSPKAHEGPWAKGPWVHEAKSPWARRASVPMSPRAHVPHSPWTHESNSPWAQRAREPKSPKLYIYLIIIIWLSPYVLFVQSLSPPKTSGLDPPNFCRHTPKKNWTTLKILPVLTREHYTSLLLWV
jgi:hypothetical protein